MRLSIQNWIVDRYPEDIQVDMISNAGFNSVDWDLIRIYLDKKESQESLEQSREYYMNLRAHMNSRNLEVCQTHAPFPTFQKNIVDKNRIAHALELAIMATSILGAKYTIIHPYTPLKYNGDTMREERVRINIAFYKSLIPLLEKYDVYCCIENMFSWDVLKNKPCETSCSYASEMRELLAGIDHPRFKFCFDSGHSNIICNDNLYSELELLGSELTALHLHDNNGRFDLHQPFGAGNIDFDRVMTVLDTIGYNETYSFEIHPRTLGRWKSRHQSKLSQLHDKLRASLEKFEN